MKKTKFKTPYQVLKEVKAGNYGQVTYYFSDGSSQTNPINIEMFTDDRGNRVSLNKILNIFEDTKNDRMADEYRLSA